MLHPKEHIFVQTKPQTSKPRPNSNPLAVITIFVVLIAMIAVVLLWTSKDHDVLSFALSEKEQYFVRIHAKQA